MSLTGKNALSIRKKEVKEQNSLALGVKKIVFAHKATLGETGIDVTALVSPTEMSLNGFVNPNVADILASNMFFYRKNVTITSSAKNSLIQDLSFSIRSSSRINFLGFTAEEGEIFTVTIDQSARTSLLAVDASPISATGTLAAGLTDFNVGAPFQVNAFPIFQVGAVTVFVDGVQQFRNTNNQAAPADGNYYEVDPGGGFATLIRLNSSSLVDRDILVKSNGFAEKPDISQMAEIEKVQGQIDAMVPDLAQATGNPETNYQAAPNNIDLKQFGDRLLDLENAVYKVGDVVSSMLDEAAFQAQRSGSASWALMDGRSVVGSSYEAVTGNSTIPDARGQFLRGKNNGRSDGQENPDGDSTLGTQQTDELISHTHSGGQTAGSGVGGNGGSWVTGPANVGNTGGNETRPKNITVNYFIRID